MTLTKEQRAAYGPEWLAVRDAILHRAGGRCECQGECGWTRHLVATDGSADDPWRDPAISPRCPALNRQPSPLTGSRVVLTIAHLDHDGHLGVHRDDRLRAMCQGCHLAYDRAYRESRNS